MLLLPPYVFQPLILHYGINATIARESHLNFELVKGSHSAVDLWLLYLERRNYFLTCRVSSVLGGEA